MFQNRTGHLVRRQWQPYANPVGGEENKEEKGMTSMTIEKNDHVSSDEGGQE